VYVPVRVEVCSHVVHSFAHEALLVSGQPRELYGERVVLARLP
jgi:hypothetical protein